MNKIDYIFTLASSRETAIMIISILTKEYKDLFKTCNIDITPVNYSDWLMVLNINFKNSSSEELEKFINNLIDYKLVGEDWKLAKECE